MGLGEGHIEEEGDRSCKGQGASIEEDIRIEENSQGPLSKMLVNVVLTSKDDKRVNRIESVEAMKCRINNRDRVLVLAQSCKGLGLNQDGYLERTQ